MTSIHDIKEKSYKNYYGASKRVYRKSDVDKMIRMWSDLHYLSELRERTRLVPHNEEFLKQKAIPSYNRAVIRLQKIYPNIKEFQRFKLIKK